MWLIGEWGWEERRVAMQKWSPYLSIQFSKKFRPTINTQNIVYFNSAESQKEDRLITILELSPPKIMMVLANMKTKEKVYKVL